MGSLNIAQSLVKGKATSIVRKTDRYFVKVTSTVDSSYDGGKMLHFPQQWKISELDGTHTGEVVLY